MFVVNDVTLAALMTGVADMTFTVTCLTPMSVIDVPVIEGQVGVQSTNQAQVTRTAAFVVTRDVIDSGLLNPLSDKVYIRCAVRGQPSIPLFFGRVNTHQENEHGQVTVNCVGQLSDVINDAFPVPWANSGAPAAQEIALIIHDNDATIGVVIDPAVPPTQPPAQTWSDSRGQAIQDLLKTLSANMQDGRAGGAIIYLNPFGIPNPPNTGIVLRDGVNGTIITVTHNKSRENIYNSITITSEPMSDASGQQGIPIRVTVVDSDPSSPTFYGGPFGKRNKNYSIQSSMLAHDLKVLALQVLRQSLALAETWTITTPFMPILDPDDVFGAVFNGVTYQLVVESVQHNGEGNTSTSITARKLQFLSDLNYTQ